MAGFIFVRDTTLASVSGSKGFNSIFGRDWRSYFGENSAGEKVPAINDSLNSEERLIA